MSEWVFTFITDYPAQVGYYGNDQTLNWFEKMKHRVRVEMLALFYHAIDIIIVIIVRT